MKYLNRYIRQSIRARWYDLGVELLGDDDIEALNKIKCDNKNDDRICCTEMFQLWLEKQPMAPWKQLIESLRQPSVNLKELANQIEQTTGLKYNTLINYTFQLKNRYNTKWIPENQWPLFTPAKFVNVGFIIHKPKRTTLEANRYAKSARLGTFSSDESIHLCDTFFLKGCDDNSFDKYVTIEEDISGIFLPNGKYKRPQIILIEGAPGIGKTMLMEEIKYLWANEKILIDKEVLLLLPLCDPKINEIKYIEDLFYYSCKSREDAKMYAKHFVRNSGQGLVILLDGLDENPKAMRMQSGAFFYDILIEQKIFIEACIVITSRPHASTELQQFVSYRVELIGFTDERRQEFVEHNFKENAEVIVDYLQKHEIIDTLCYIPLNMSILVSLFKENIRLEILPTTQTELILQAIKITVFHNLEKLGIYKNKINLETLPKPYDKIFYYVSELAYNALVENRVTFTIDEIRKACPVSTNGDEKIERAVINGLGLLQTAKFFTDADGDTRILSNFAHYSVQELLAAWYIAFRHHYYFQNLPLMCSIQNGVQKCIQFSFQLKILKDKFWEGNFIDMWSFYIGLTGGDDFAFKHFLSEKMLYSCKRLYSHQNTISSGTIEHVNAAQCTISKNILENKIKVLLLYILLQEAPNNEMLEYLDSVVTRKTLDVSGQPLGKKEDIYLLGYILSRPYLTKQWKFVNISHCGIDDEKFKVLYEVLTRNDGRPKPEIEALSLSGNKLKSSCSIAIAHLVCCQKIQHLYLSSNLLADVVPFKQCGDFLETLHISNNKLGNKNALELFTILKSLRKLKVLKLSHNNIYDDQHVIDAIGLALCSCNSLKELELDGNTTEFEDKAMLLFQVINEIKSSTSNVHYYRLTDKAHAFLKILGYCDQIDYQVELCVLKNKIMQSIVVNVSYNGLKTDDGCNLGQHLHLLVNLKILNITNNNISDEATKSLVIGMLLTPNLEEFKYDKNLFNEDSTRIFEVIYQLRKYSNKTVLKCASSKVKALVFILNCINDNEKKLQSSDIVYTISHITELNLSHNEPTTLDYKLTSEDFNELCAVLKWFKQLKVLDVRNNNITDEIIESMVKVMLQINTLHNLKLCGNPISGHTFYMAIFETIKNVREKQIQSIIYDQKDPSSCTKCKSIIYIMDCLNQLKNPNCFKSFDNITTVDTDSESNYGAKLLEYLKFLPFLTNLKVNNVEYITDCGINQLSKYLSHNRTLTTLDLSFCNLCYLEVENVPSSNFPLQTLKLNHCNITDQVLFKLFLNILKFTNLNQLELEGNCFGDKGISSMYNVLMSCENDQLSTTITSLNLVDNHLTEHSTIKILEIVQLCMVNYLNISNNNLGSIFPNFEHSTITTLELLNISSNGLKANAVYLGQCLHLLVNLRILDISKNDISDAATKSLTTGILLTPNLEEFKYDENSFSEENIMIFKMIHRLRISSNTKLFKCTPLKLKALVFILNCINDNEEKLQSSDIVSTISHITDLNLSHNEPTTLDYKLTSEDFNELCAVLKWFKQLKVLDVRNNNITNEARESVAKIMLQFSTLNTYSLKLHGNPIFDDKLSMAIFYAIENIRKKKIQSITHNRKSLSIECQCILYIMDYLNQLENPNCFKLFENITTVDTDLESKYGTKILEYLKFLPFLRDLKINHIKCITDCGINQLSKYLCYNRTLATLDLSFCDLCNLEVENRSSNNFPLQTLKLNHCNITDKILFKLSLNMLKFTNLNQLELEGNHFGDKGIYSMHDALLSCENDQLCATITSLNLANNQLTACSDVKIIEIVKICKVKCLNISKNDLSTIFTHFEQCTITTLEELNISANNHHNAKQFAKDISYLKSCSSLKKLDISNNNIDETAIDEISSFFIVCSHLEEVLYKENPAYNEIELAFLLVQDLYNKQSCIKSISFHKKPRTAFTLISQISPQCNSKFAKSVKIQLSQVNVIDFSCNHMEIDENFMCLLEICTQLEELNLEGNNITNGTFKYLMKGLYFTTKLKQQNLHLKENPCMDSQKNIFVLEIIETLRWKTEDYFNCYPAMFESFLTVLELVDSVTGRQNDIIKKISLIKCVNLSHSERPSDSFDQRLKNTNKKLQSRDIKIFCKYFKYFKSLRSIQMIGNNITEDVKDDLAIAVLKNHNVIEIQLVGNPAYQSKCSKLLDTIGNVRTSKKWHKSEKMHSSNPYMYPFQYHAEALEALVSMLKYIKNFDDKSCDITANMEELDISCYPHRSIEKVDNPVEITTGLICHLKLFSRLKMLNLCSSFLTLDALQELSEYLHNNDTLLQLDISQNNIQVTGALIFLRSLNKCTTLRRLNMEENNITGKESVEIATIIRSFLNLKVEILKGNELNEESRKMLKSK